MDKKQAFSLWYVLAALVGMILLREFVTPRHTQTLTHSEFKQALMAGKLDDVVISDGIAAGKLRAEGLEQILPKDKLEALKRVGGDHGFATVLVNDPGPVAQLDAANHLLAEMDGFDTNRGVIILAATNRPEVLDPALLRPGRFDRHVAIDRPDLIGRRQILEVHVKNVKLAPAVDLAVLAARTPGFAGADLANLVNEATVRAAKWDKEAVDMQDFEEALDRIVAGLEKKKRVMNPTERKFVAYHEAGHALVAELRKNADRVTKVSIIPRGIAALGYTQQSPTEDRYLMRRSELLDRLNVLLAGRVAEQLVFEDVSTGAENDLQRATDMARHMVTHYGMSEALGLATYDARPTPLYLNGPMLPEPRTFSERTAEAIDGEVRRLLDEARDRVTQTLRTNRETLEALAALLLEKEVVDRKMLDGLMASTAAPAQLRVAAVALPPAEGAS